MAKSLKSKVLSYGLVEIVDTESSWGSQYQLLVAGKIKYQSNDLQYIISEFEKLW